jgi:hypothetical protein
VEVWFGIKPHDLYLAIGIFRVEKCVSGVREGRVRVSCVVVVFETGAVWHAADALTNLI